MKDNQNTQKKPLTIMDVILLVKLNIWIVLAIMILSIGAGIFYDKKTVSNTYVATSTLAVNVEEIIGRDSADETTKYTYSQALIKNFIAVLANQSFFNGANHSYDGNGNRATDVGISRPNISFNYSEENPLVFDISYTLYGNDESLRTKVKDTLDNYVAWCIKELNKPDEMDEEIFDTPEKVAIFEKYGYYGRAEGSIPFLKDRLTIVSYSITTVTPSSQKKLAFIVIGLLLSVVEILIRYIFDDTLTTKEDVEALTGTDVLSLVGFDDPNAGKNKNKNFGRK